MIRPVVLGDEAEADLEAAVDWYEERAELGEKFLDEIRDTLTRIGRNPQGHPLVDQEIRCGLVRRFPYVIFYRVHDDRVEVIAIAHGHRDPSEWRKRL